MVAPGFRIEPVETAEDIAGVKALLRRHNHIPPEDPRSAAFEDELTAFPAGYELVLIAKSGGVAVGCVCLRKLDTNASEMKRMFVAPEVRGAGIGRALADRLIAEAKAFGFAEMKLDTLERLKAAGSLFRSLGFRPTPPYNDNPEPDVVYYAKELT